MLTKKILEASNQIKPMFIFSLSPTIKNETNNQFTHEITRLI